MKHLTSLILIFCSFFSYSQNVGIGTTTPHASAALDISDTSRGILIPRMTIAQRNGIQNPAEGLMVYQTDSTYGFWYWGRGSWKNIINSIQGYDTTYKGIRIPFSSSTLWTCPPGVFKVAVQLWGAGGGGGASSFSVNYHYGGKGGNGGQNGQNVAVIPGKTYSIIVGVGGEGGGYSYAGSDGGATSFDGIFSAEAGKGGAIFYGGYTAPNGLNGAIIPFSVPYPSFTSRSYIPSNLTITSPEPVGVAIGGTFGAINGNYILPTKGEDGFALITY